MIENIKTDPIIFKKNNWERKKLGKVFKLNSGNGLPRSKHKEGTHPVYGGNGIIGYHNNYMVKEPTLVIGRVGSPGSIHLTSSQAWITDNCLYPTEFLEEVNLLYLKYLLEFIDLGRYAQKTAQPSISQSTIYNIDVLIPPLADQERIVELFQSIENCISITDGQEVNLTTLKSKLLLEIFSEPYLFGTFLSSNDCENVYFRDICENISERVEPKETELEIYVGLEHLDSEDLNIKRWGKPCDVIGTKLKFCKGDIIFGKRRAYLKKVAVAEFDGIASAHSMVLRARTEKIQKDFLPYFMQSDEFMNRAVKISEGSLSPTIKWNTLSQQQFRIPKIDKQNKLIQLFKNIDKCREQTIDQKTTLQHLKQKLLNSIFA